MPKRKPITYNTLDDAIMAAQKDVFDYGKNIKGSYPDFPSPGDIYEANGTGINNIWINEYIDSNTIEEAIDKHKVIVKEPTWDKFIQNSMERSRYYLTNYAKAFDWFKHFEESLSIDSEYYSKSFQAMKPEIKLVEIGTDIEGLDLFKLKDKVNVVKSCNGYAFKFFKGEHLLLSFPPEGKLPISIFEWYKAPLIKPKTDLVLFLAPYHPHEDVLIFPYYQNHGLNIMKKFSIEDAKKLLIQRKAIFEASPTAVNLILLFQLMDAIILNEYKTGSLEVDSGIEKRLVRLEKLKNLAKGTKYNEERKLAVVNCFTQYGMIFGEDKKDAK